MFIQSDGKPGIYKSVEERRRYFANNTSELKRLDQNRSFAVKIENKDDKGVVFQYRENNRWFDINPLIS